MPPHPTRPPLRAAVAAPDFVLRAHGVPHQLLPQAVASGSPALHLDLAAVAAPSAGGLGRLVALHWALRAAGVRLVLVNVRPQAQRVFEVTGLTQVLEVRPREATAAGLLWARSTN